MLIDTYNHLRRQHPELDQVSLIVRTGAQRLRPVMLTTVTTVFGLLPLASHFSIDFINRSIVYGGPALRLLGAAGAGHRLRPHLRHAADDAGDAGAAAPAVCKGVAKLAAAACRAGAARRKPQPAPLAPAG